MSYRIMHSDRKKISLMINFIDIEKLIVDYLLSSSDSSDEELLLYTHLMRKKKIPRMKHCITSVVDQYTAEDVNIY